MRIQSEDFSPYPRIPNHPGGGQVAGVLAGSPPPGSSPASNPALPVIISPLLSVPYRATIVGVPTVPVDIPIGASTLVKYVQVVNQGPGFIFVAQGSEMGVIPPFTLCSYTLTSTVGSPIQLAGWDGGNTSVTNTNGDVVVLWSSNPFRNDLSWDGPVPGSFVGIPFEVDASSTPGALVYDGVQGSLPGEAEQWHLSFSAFSLAAGAPVAAGKDGIALVNVLINNLTLSAPATDSDIQFFTTTYSFGRGSRQEPFVGAGLYYYESKEATALVPSPTMVQLNIVVTQPTGSSPLGSGGLSGGAGSLCEITQYQLQA